MIAVNCVVCVYVVGGPLIIFHRILKIHNVLLLLFLLIFRIYKYLLILRVSFGAGSVLFEVCQIRINIITVILKRLQMLCFLLLENALLVIQRLILVFTSITVLAARRPSHRWNFIDQLIKIF